MKDGAKRGEKELLTRCFSLGYSIRYIRMPEHGIKVADYAIN